MFGCSAAFSPVLHCIEHNPPRPGDSACDLGCGMGVWGHLLRTYWPHLRVVGVDLDPEPNDWRVGYQTIYPDDILAWCERVAAPTPTAAPYWLGLAMDVVEHLDDESAEALLRIMPRVARNWFVATPSVWQDRNAPGLTRHRSCWPAERLATTGAWAFLYPAASTEDAWPGFGMVLAYRGQWALGTVPSIRVVCNPQLAHARVEG